MNELINFDDNVSNRIITIRNQMAILDSDVAKIYDVETKRINEAVKNNPDKFPKGYIIELKNSEFHDLRSKFSTANLEKTRVMPKAFTEKGLYMLATILKSEKATTATIEIVETFAKMRELSRNIAILNSTESEVIEPEIVESTGGLIKDLFFSHFPTTSSETSLEFNVGVIKGKRTLKSENPTIQNELESLKKRMEQLEKLMKP
jgi:hypothetical protein